MIKKTKDGYRCEECKLVYAEKAWAERCEEWCKKTHTCNLDIIKHALKPE